ncbi:MAG: hypothetical protein JJE55_05545 [Flavobacteriaceae bacterium]|nr:hypothetical protein [Flavobacteriaceae bacterium]
MNDLINKNFSQYFFLCIFFFVLSSCSKKDIENDSFTPPDWLIGTWDHENPQAILKTYIVTTDNIVLEYPNGDLLDYGARARENDGYYIREITNNDAEYKYELVDEYNSDPEQAYIVTFRKVSDNQITNVNSLQHTGPSEYNRR